VPTRFLSPHSFFCGISSCTPSHGSLSFPPGFGSRPSPPSPFLLPPHQSFPTIPFFRAPLFSFFSLSPRRYLSPGDLHNKTSFPPSSLVDFFAFPSSPLGRVSKLTAHFPPRSLLFFLRFYSSLGFRPGCSAFLPDLCRVQFVFPIHCDPFVYRVPFARVNISPSPLSFF